MVLVQVRFTTHGMTNGCSLVLDISEATPHETEYLLYYFPHHVTHPILLDLEAGMAPCLAWLYPRDCHVQQIQPVVV